jgi:hypothetical protein
VDHFPWLRPVRELVDEHDALLKQQLGRLQIARREIAG